MPAVSVNDVSLHYDRQGQGQPLLLVHGFPLDHSMWRHQSRELSEIADVIAVDLRGFGRSSLTPETVSMAQYADDLAALLDAIEVRDPIVLAGLSMGGYIAWQFWARHRDRLAGLIQCDTRAAADTEEAARGREIAAARVLREGPGFLADSMMEKLFADATRQEQPSVVAATQTVMRNADPEAVAAALRGMAQRPDMTPQLGEIDLPTLLIVGEHDAITPSSEMRSVAQAIPNATFVEIETAGHMAPLESPQRVNGAIREFLRELPARD